MNRPEEKNGIKQNPSQAPQKQPGQRSTSEPGRETPSSSSERSRQK